MNQNLRPSASKGAAREDNCDPDPSPVGLSGTGGISLSNSPFIPSSGSERRTSIFPWKAYHFRILPLFHLQGGAVNQNLQPSASKGAAREDQMNQNLQPSASKGAAREGNETTCMSGDDRQTQSDHHKLASNPNWHCPMAKSSVVQAGPTWLQLGGDPSWLPIFC
mgnify:CR=1 FL=1